MSVICTQKKSNVKKINTKKLLLESKFCYSIFVKQGPTYSSPPVIFLVRPIQPCQTDFKTAEISNFQTLSACISKTAGFRPNKCIANR